MQEKRTYIMKAAFKENTWEGKCVDDKKIIELYWERKEIAITETSLKYGKLCTHVARNILSSYEDSEESQVQICV